METNLIKEINKKHVHESDKWFRMYAGVSSALTRYENKIAHIEVRNTERQLKSNIELVSKIIATWKRVLNQELKTTNGFVVYLYKTNKSTGFVLSGEDINDTKLQEQLTGQMNVKEELILVNIFSGMLD